MSHEIESINIKNLIKAQDRFEQFRKNLNSDQEKAGAIQAFEFCYELAWKTLKRVLGSRGIEVNSPRETFREAAREKLISDPEKWFEFLKKRNLTAHTYNQENAEEIVKIFDSFSKELAEVIKSLNNICK